MYKEEERNERCYLLFLTVSKIGAQAVCFKTSWRREEQQKRQVLLKMTPPTQKGSFCSVFVFFI